MNSWIKLNEIKVWETPTKQNNYNSVKEVEKIVFLVVQPRIGRERGNRAQLPFSRICLNQYTCKKTYTSKLIV